MNSTLPCDRGATVENNEASDRSTGEEFGTVSGIKTCKQLVYESRTIEVRDDVIYAGLNPGLVYGTESGTRLRD